MEFQFSPYMLPLIGSALVSGWIAAYVWTRRSTRSAPALVLLALAIMIWSIGYALEIAGANLSTKIFWGKVQYIGIVSVPLLWFIFAYNYASRDKRLTHRAMMLTAIVPGITLVLAFTTDLHGLIWQDIGIQTAANFSALQVSHGLWFWIHSAYSYALLLMGTIYIVQSARHMWRPYRGQAIALFVAVIVPWISNFAYLAGFSPIPYLDPTPFAFTISLLALVWGIFGFRLMDLSPVARDMVVEEMSEGMIVLDAQDRVADINPAAERLLEVTGAQAIGRPIAEILRTWPQVLDRFSDILDTVDEITVGSSEAQRWYEVRIAPLKDRRQRVAGRVITVRNITERKLVEERLLQERNLLRTVINNIPDQIFVRDRDSRFVLSNLSDARAMGVTDPETLVGKTDYDFYPPEQAVQFQADNQAVIQSGEPLINREERVGADERDLRWVLTTKVPLHDRRGDIIGLVGIARDVTERKQAEEFRQSFLNDIKALQQLQLTLSEIDDLDTLYITMINLSQQRLGLDRVRLFLFDRVTNELQGTYSINPDGQVRDERYYREPITPDHWTRDTLNAPDHVRLWDDAPLYDNATVVGTGWKVAATLWNGRAAVGYLVCDNFLTHKPARPYEAELLSLLGNTFGHLIERKRADEQVRQLSRAVEASPTSIVITDTSGSIQYVNPKFTEATGYTFQEALGENPRILKSGLTPREVHQHMWETIQAGHEWHGEFCNRKKNGEIYWEWASISPIVDAAGHISHYVAVKEDITERKRAQQELALARDQALAASQYKTELMAKVSHELRTPLGAIMGYAEFLHKEMFAPLTPQQKHFTGEILDSTSYLNGLVNDLLDEAQMERGKIQIQPALFDVRQMAGQLTVALKPAAQTKDLDFSLSVTPDLPVNLFGDQKRIRQIMTNLISNAIKFTTAGSVTAQIQRPDPQHWSIQVADTGPGMPPEVQARIFEAFWQADGSPTRQHKGYGLGLSIVKQLTDLMGGEISVLSEVNRGSTFCVVLPLTEPTKSQE
jgi:PAS domain S-box-containing protein